MEKKPCPYCNDAGYIRRPHARTRLCPSFQCEAANQIEKRITTRCDDPFGHHADMHKDLREVRRQHDADFSQESIEIGAKNVTKL